jgi:hypothetical protein
MMPNFSFFFPSHGHGSVQKRKRLTCLVGNEKQKQTRIFLKMGPFLSLYLLLIHAGMIVFDSHLVPASNSFSSSFVWTLLGMQLSVDHLLRTSDYEKETKGRNKGKSTLQLSEYLLPLHHTLLHPHRYPHRYPHRHFPLLPTQVTT